MKFSSTFWWECREHPGGDCEKTFPSGTHIHRHRTRETCCLFSVLSSNEHLFTGVFLNSQTSLLRRIIAVRRGAELVRPDRLSDTRFGQASSCQLGNDIFSIHHRQIFQVVTIFHKIINQFVVVVHVRTEIHKQSRHIDASSAMKQIV